MRPIQATQHTAISDNTYVAAQPKTAAFSDAMAHATQSLDAIFERAAQMYDVPNALLKAIAKAESNFNPKAVSCAGAQGVMQLMPTTAKALGVTDSFDPEQNIMGGAKYISQMLKKYNGNTALALAAYNAGSGNVAKYGGIPPFRETQNYVKKVMAYAGDALHAGTYTPSIEPSKQQAELAQSILQFIDFTQMDYLLFVESLKYRTSASLSAILSDTQTEDKAQYADPFGEILGQSALAGLHTGMSAKTASLLGNRFQKLYE